MRFSVILHVKCVCMRAYVCVIECLCVCCVVINKLVNNFFVDQLPTTRTESTMVTSFGSYISTDQLYALIPKIFLLSSE